MIAISSSSSAKGMSRAGEMSAGPGIVSKNMELGGGARKAERKLKAHANKKPATQDASPAGSWAPGISERSLAVLAGADAGDRLERKDENLAVADLAGLGGGDDRVDRLPDRLVGNGDLDFDLGQEVDRVLAAAVDLGVALLTAEAFDFSHGHSLDARLGERGFNFLE